VMQRALSRDPNVRYPRAHDFAGALSPFEADPRLAVREIAARVRWVQAAQSSDHFAAVRDSVRQLKASVRPSTTSPPEPRRAVESVVPAAVAPKPAEEKVEEEEKPGPPEHKTAEYQLLPSHVIRANGEKLGPWAFARLMEALATGQIQRG